MWGSSDSEDYSGSDDELYLALDYHGYEDDDLRRPSIRGRGRNRAPGTGSASSDFFHWLFDDPSGSSSPSRARRPANGTNPDSHLFHLLGSIEALLANADTTTTTTKEPEDVALEAEHGVPSLLEMSARSVAKHYSCQHLENHDPPLDESLLKRVARWSFPEDLSHVYAIANLSQREGSWSRAELMANDGCIRDMWQVGFMATAFLCKWDQNSTASSDIRVSLTFEQQRILSSTCSGCRDNVWCRHVLAAIIYRIQNPKQVRVHAPVTEVLSTLNRDQLQKLLQYAINDDPASILGNVFKNIDAIRDSESQINATPGAPDPTFGGLNDGQKSQWQITLEDFQKNFEETISDRVNYLNRKLYMDSYDIEAKIGTKLSAFLHHALRLTRKREYMLAAETMKIIIESSIAIVVPPYAGTNELIQRFMHDLDRGISQLIVYLKDHCPAAHKMLINTVKQANSKSSTIDPLLRQPLPRNQYVEMPSLIPVYKQQLAKSDCVHQGPFMESYAAQFVPEMPDELKSLLDGRTTVSACTYREDPAVMVVRMEALLMLDHVTTFTKYYKIADRVLRVLTGILLKESILNVFCDDEERQKKVDCVFNIAAPQAEESAPVAKYWKGRKRRSSSRLGKQPMKKSKRSLTKDQKKNDLALSYALMNTLWMVNKCRKFDNNLADWNLTQLFSMNMLALELCHYQSLNEDLNDKARNWLLKMEAAISKQVECFSPMQSGAYTLYMEAMLVHGSHFFNHVYPLALLEILCVYGTKQDMNFRPSMILELCYNMMISSASALDEYASSLKNNSSYISFNDFVSMEAKSLYSHYVVKKTVLVFENFLSLVDMEGKQSSMVQEVLTVFRRHSNVLLLRCVERALRTYLIKLQKSPAVLEAAFQLVIYILETVRKRTFYSADGDMMTCVARAIGYKSLGLLSKRWPGIMTCNQLVDLISCLRSSFEHINPLPAEVVTVIFELLRSTEWHSEKDTLALLAHFKEGTAHYTEAIRVITDQTPTAFHPNVLFHLAKEKYNKSLPKGADPAIPKPLSQPVFQIVEKALQILPELHKNRPVLVSNSLLDDILPHMSWLFDCCFCKAPSSLVKDAIFKKLIAVMCDNTYYCGKCELLLLLTERLKDKPACMEKARQQVFLALLKSFLNSYSAQLLGISHTAYKNLVRGMKKSRDSCKQLSANGESAFLKEVVLPVMSKNARKKKLVEIMKEEFDL